MRKKNALFVCTGNTCRSPMAEMIFNFLAKEAGIDYRATSAGVNAKRYCKMNMLAEVALKEAGIPVRKTFLSRPLTTRQIQSATLVICMTEGTAEAVKTLSSVSEYKISVPEGGIPDPYGGGKDFYSDTAKRIYSCCDDLVKRLKSSNNLQSI